MRGGSTRAGTVGQYDRSLMRCRRPFDDIERELATRPASQARTEPIGNLLRGHPARRLRGTLRGRFDELAVGDAVAETDVHVRVRHWLVGRIVNEND